MTREELATHIFCAYLANPNRGAFHYSDCFDKATAFLAYAANEREKGKPTLRHAWPGGGKPCVNCGWYSDENPEQICYGGAPKVKEQRRPREWVIDTRSQSKDGCFDAWWPEDAGEYSSNVRVREIMPEGN